MGTLTCHADLYDECGYNPPICELSRQVDEKAMPLTVLADRLTVGPPSIGMLIDLLEQSEFVQAFLELVREYLPEHEREIMAGDYSDRAYRFCELFSGKYFELDHDMIDLGDDALAELVHSIPIRPQGLGYEQYHNFEYMPDPMILMLSLVASPWIEPEDEEEGARVPLLERVAELVGPEMTECIPKEGWDPAELHRRLDGTKYQTIASFAEWVWQDTGLGILDYDYEYCGCGFGADLIDWSRETVDRLTEQWPKVREFWDNINHMDNWLLDSVQANFGELLDFLLEKETFKVPKEQLPLALDEATDQKKPKTLVEIFREESNEREGQSGDLGHFEATSHDPDENGR